MRRLSNLEVDNSLKDILNDNSRPAAKFLPADPLTPYDNDIAEHIPSAPLIEGLETLAADVSTRLLANTALRNQLFGCTSTGVSDSSCMTTLVTRLSTRLFRRPQTGEDISHWVELALAQATLEGDFYKGADFFLRLALMHPKFIYRFEVGSDQGRLDGYELASRLAYMIWGSTPDQELLDLAANGSLQDKDQLEAKALQMLEDARAVRRAQQFHAQWLGYQSLGHSAALNASMKMETDAMIERVIFTDQRPWMDIFKINETKIDANLAAIYGLPTVTTPTWTSFGSDRKGLLSTGSFLSVAPKFGDTSPTQRGLFVRTRLLCQKVPPPPPTVNADEPPPPPDVGPNCKKTRYQAHAQEGGSCTACHALMDPVGFGLEQYDTRGKFRAYDTNPDGTANTNCPLDGEGRIAGKGDFIGPGAMSDLLLSIGAIQPCVVQQYAHFAFGRDLAGQDDQFLNYITNALTRGSGKFQDVVAAIVTSDEFMNP
ncbi:MAG: DUF1592 domain-containing protein [Bdellovibrionales bacterium]